MTSPRLIPTHKLFSVSRPLVSNAGLARTLAECLYWSQHARHFDDGKPLIWKTGKELAEKLGISSRTANEHLKQLRDQGFWEIEYRPRPGASSPSPVTWLRFSQRSLDLRSEADLVQTRRRRNTSSEPAGSAQPCEENTDSPMSENATDFQLDIQTNEQADEAEEFILNSGKPKAGKKELFSSSVQEELQGQMKKLPAPSYAKATADDVAFFNAVQQELVERELPEWDWSSHYAWQHVKFFRKKLSQAGHPEVAAQLSLFGEILDKWGWMRTVMTERFAFHKLNAQRPTPMALASQHAELLKSLESSKAPVKQSCSGCSNLDEDF